MFGRLEEPPAATTAGGPNPTQTTGPMHQANTIHSTPQLAAVTASEALCLRCVLQCQNDHGIKPPDLLGLPRSIGLVVDYDYVKRLMFTKLLRDEDNTPDGLARHREKVKKAIKRAREKLMHGRVVGCYDPFIWWTGKPVNGVKETIKTRRIGPMSAEVRP
jgi:hypothetical protein